MGISSIFMYSLNLVKAIRFAIMSLIIIFTSIFYPSISSAYILSKNPFLVFPSLLYDTVILLFNPIIFLIILMILIYLRKRKNYITEAQIRKKILNLAAKFDYLKLKDLAKQINVDKDTIVDTVNKMINAKEVYAEFFNISQKFSFNKQANTAEIDKLLQLYNDWEERQFGKF